MSDAIFKCFFNFAKKNKSFLFQINFALKNEVAFVLSRYIDTRITNEKITILLLKKIRGIARN